MSRPFFDAKFAKKAQRAQRRAFLATKDAKNAKETKVGIGGEGERPREPPHTALPRKKGAIRFCLAQRRRGAERFLAGAGGRRTRGKGWFLAAKDAKGAKVFRITNGFAQA